MYNYFFGYKFFETKEAVRYNKKTVFPAYTQGFLDTVKELKGIDVSVRILN